MAMTGEVAYILAKKYADTQAGKPSKEEIDSSIKDYLDQNPVYTGASEEEKAQIEQSAKDVATALEQIAQAQGGIETIQTTITAMETTIATVSEDVDTLKANAETVDSSLADINAELAKHWKELEGHWKAIAKSDKDIVKLDSDIVKLTNDVVTFDTKLTNFETKLNEKADKVDLDNYYDKETIDEKLANLDLGDFDIDSAIVDEINTVKENVTTLQTDVQTLTQKQISDQTATVGIIATIQHSLATQEQNITTIQSDITGLKDKVKDYEDKSFATEEYVNAQVAGLIDSAPEALDTLQELASALGNDKDFANTVTTAIGNKADKEHTHSYNDLTDLPEDLTSRVEALEKKEVDIPQLEGYATEEYVNTALLYKADKEHTHSYNDLSDLPNLDEKADVSWVQEELDKKSNKGHKHTDIYDRLDALEAGDACDCEELKEQVNANTSAITEINDVTIPTLATKSRIEELEALIESLTAEVTDLKKSVSDGKELVAKAITRKGVPTATDSTFEELAENIRKINQAELTEEQKTSIEENMSAEITEEGDLVIEHPTETLDVSFERQEDDLIMEDNTTGLVDARINDKGELEVEY